jgi:hypothetical protein
MRYISIISLCALLACAGQQSVASRSTLPLWEEAETLAVRAEYGADRATRLQAATQGVGVANACVKKYRREPACYYYRAVLTGLFYQMTVVGYQKGIKQMIADARTLEKLDPTYAQAGAYRILGQIYTDLPASTFRPDSVSRDLDKARGYLAGAATLSPESVANHLALCKTLSMLQDFSVARLACAAAEELMAGQQKEKDYKAWRTSLRQLKKALAQRSSAQ